jgi:MFS family permease
MLVDWAPLRRNRDFRLLFAGQAVSLIGSRMTYVTVPYQVYTLTRSSFMVGLVSAAQLVPVLLLGLLGGAFADSLPRKKLLVTCEALMGVGAIALTVNALVPHPSVALIFVATAFMQACDAFHRPTMDALTQALVEPEDYAAIGALGALRGGLGSILGPALGGVLMASGGPAVTYGIDAASFLFAVATIAAMRRALPPPAPSTSGHLNAIVEGLQFAVRRPELMGTYIVDLVAMIFAFPVALFPEMAQRWGDASKSAWMFAALSAGGVLATVLSGWTGRVRRRGAAVVVAAAVWGLCVTGAGIAPGLWSAAVMLGLAGAADTISGLFRSVIWNETVPNELRGRLAGVEMISYMSGPLIGNTRAGWLAGTWSLRGSLVSGGLTCAAGVVLCAGWLRQFWYYEPPTKI